MAVTWWRQHHAVRMLFSRRDREAGQSWWTMGTNAGKTVWDCGGGSPSSRTTFGAPNLSGRWSRLLVSTPGWNQFCPFICALLSLWLFSSTAPDAPRQHESPPFIFYYYRQPNLPLLCFLTLLQQYWSRFKKGEIDLNNQTQTWLICKLIHRKSIDTVWFHHLFKQRNLCSHSLFLAYQTIKKCFPYQSAGWCLSGFVWWRKQDCKIRLSFTDYWELK